MPFIPAVDLRQHPVFGIGCDYGWRDVLHSVQSFPYAKAFLSCLCWHLPVSAAVFARSRLSAAIDTSLGTANQQYPAAMETFQLPSHGAQLNALTYIAAGAGPHPVVVLLHGFPGNEKNLDLAQTIRRAGWDVLYFDYRGSWGSPGDFSFTHSAEDVASALAYLRDPANSAKLRADPKRIVLIGHSMGGFMTAYGRRP